MPDLETVYQVAEQFRDAAADVLAGRPEGGDVDVEQRSPGRARGGDDDE